MAGGLGVRLACVSGDNPKPMMPLCGKPGLLWQLENLRKSGIEKVTLALGYRGEKIKEYFGDGKALQMELSYVWEEEPLGTAGVLFKLRDRLREPFFVINGDLIFDVDFQAFYRAFRGKATVFVHPNTHPQDSYRCRMESGGRITGWRVKENARNLVCAGLYLLSPDTLAALDGGYANLDKDIIAPLVGKGQVYGYCPAEYVKDYGTPQRLLETEQDIKHGFLASRSRKHARKAIFLDRDGVLNRLNGFITKPEQLELLPKAGEAVKRINQSEYLAIVATNQPVIARGDCSFEGLYQIHAKLDGLLGEAGAFLDDIFLCPHHPDKGFEGERTEYKINCDCRKPKPGLLMQAAEKYGLSLEDCWMIGDTASDEMAGRAAGCRTILLGRDAEGLYEAIGLILDRDK